MAQFLFQHYHLEWWMVQKDIALDPMGMLVLNDFKTKLNERFTSHNQNLKDGQEIFNLHIGIKHGSLLINVQNIIAL